MNIQKYQAMLDKIKSPFDPQVEYKNYYQRIMDIINCFRRDKLSGSNWALADFKDKLNREVNYHYIAGFELDIDNKKLKIIWLNKEVTEFNLP